MIILRRIEVRLGEDQEGSCGRLQKNRRHRRSFFAGSQVTSSTTPANSTPYKPADRGSGYRGEPDGLHRFVLPKRAGHIRGAEVQEEIRTSTSTTGSLGVVKKFSELDLDPDTVDNVKMGYMFEGHHPQIL